jgi:hypothetical protein
LVASVYLGYLYYRGKQKTKRYILLICLFVVLGSILMIHPRSLPIWHMFDPLLKYLQFPWRFLMLVIVFISISVGSLAETVPSKYKSIIITSLLILVVVCNFSYFRPEKFLSYNETELFSGSLWDKQIKRSIYDYLPKSAEAPPAELATERYQIITGDVEVKDYTQGTDWIAMHFVSHSERIIVRLSQYYFPNWQIRVNGQVVPIDYENPLGLMTVLLGKGEFYLEADLQDTPIRIMSNWLSVLGILLTIGLLISKSNIVCKACSYAFKGFGR